MRKDKGPYPKGVRFQRYFVKEEGAYVRYGYYGRGRESIALGREGSPEFFESLAAAIRKAPGDENSVNALVFNYKTSPEFARLRPLTRRDYLKQLDKIQATFGTLSLHAMSSREIAKHIYNWRNSMVASPRRADYAVQVLKLLLAWGVKRGYLEANRAAGVDRLYTADRRENSWSDDQIAAFLAVASEPMKRAMILALETGQRQADLLALPWSAVKGGVIQLKQSKTGQPVAIAISPALQVVLDEAPRGTATQVLTRSDGLPWDPKGNGFRGVWRETCKLAGVTGVTFNDLRGTFVTRRLSAGWTTLEVAGCTGHSLRDLAMLDVYADRSRIALATAQRISQRTASIKK